MDLLLFIMYKFTIVSRQLRDIFHFCCSLCTFLHLSFRIFDLYCWYLTNLRTFSVYAWNNTLIREKQVCRQYLRQTI